MTGKIDTVLSCYKCQSFHGILTGEAASSNIPPLVPFWVLNKHHDITLPGADCVHGELSRLLHSCSQWARYLFTGLHKHITNWVRPQQCRLHGNETGNPFLLLPCETVNHDGVIKSKNTNLGTSFMVQCLRLHAPNAGGPGLFPSRN